MNIEKTWITPALTSYTLTTFTSEKPTAIETYRCKPKDYPARQSTLEIPLVRKLQPSFIDFLVQQIWSKRVGKIEDMN
jgi:hypothetical protein